MSVYVVGITGGSGAPYTKRLLEALLQTEHQVKAVISAAGEEVLKIELGLHLEGTLKHKEEQLKVLLDVDKPDIELELFDPKDLTASISSGSFPSAGMVIAPCSMGTLGRIAMGASSNLVERAADVMLKERRPLILVPRETPLSEIHLRNMLWVRRAGAEVLPAMPGFYHNPRSISDLVDFIVGRILDRLGIQNNLFRRWKEEEAPAYLSLDEF
ncbi:MAG: flavin prenyltransferase UbiX [Dehalococcoidia bacterium]